MANTPQESTLGPWRISLIAGGIQLQHGPTAFWRDAGSEIELSDGPVLRASKKILQGTTLTLEFADGLSVTHRFGQAEDWLRVTTTLQNRTTRALPLRQVRILAGKLEAAPANRIFSQSETMTGITGIFQLAGSFLSDSCVGLTDAAGTVAMVAGFEKLDEAFHRFQVKASPGETLLAPFCLREGVALAPGAVLEISPLLVGRGESLSRLLNHYAEQVAQAMGARPLGETMTGWCSWYHYYGHETSADILGNARSLAASPLKKKLKVIQIDDGWNLPCRGHPRNWGDWSPGEKFPQGMRAVADELHSLGFRAGLWLA
ncbi:MAG: hypothetical protein EBX44_16485, partial [Betaproteobacteria bacterium]|nr:hypothetical protein [Betaproteobacteria bacterium]